MTDLELDLDGAEESRAALLDRLGKSSVSADIVAALSGPGVPDWFLAHPFQVVGELDELLGQSGPHVDVPEQWRDGLPARIDTANTDQIVRLYHRLLTSATSSEQSLLVAREQLVSNWPALARELHPAVSTVWEERFTDLRR